MIYSVNKDLFFKTIGNELMIYNKNDKKTYILNETSREIFEKADGKDLLKILEEITTIYSDGNVKDDVKQMLDTFVEHGFLFIKGD